MSFECIKNYEDSYDKYVLVATSEKVVLPDYLDKESKKVAEEVIKKNKFTADASKSISMTLVNKKKVIDFIIIGLGEQKKLNSYQNYKLKEMEIVAILPEKMKKRDKKFIDSMKKKYDPFLGKATTIKVKLTTLGESLLKTFTEYRPKLIKNEKDIY